ncbi:MAG: glycosyl transferase [Candidatus Schekmanbacteria bacterium RBG_16_38_11]|uniref:Glycosyl transferase n=1 Tax=Candidatus Schekmanbacteria bacterium RBG_16_38_11 TaxID=1817880 RepID=A0A1F7RT46_9BACT|nr:MAG: glycosyl transferase [Candidatus Schekmanbacteria bacterium RBG_16_38_11]
MKISVVIPVYNEKATILDLIKKVESVNLEKEIILVDDCSTDGTREILKSLGDNKYKIFFQEKNSGKGAALRTGFDHVTGDIVIVQDADLEYDPNEYGRLIEPILHGKADVVFGSRFLAGPHRVHLFWHYLGNKMLTTLSNIFTNLNLTDMETCYKVFKAEILKSLNLKSNRFGFEPEFTAKIAKRKYRIYEVPISYYGRDYSEGKKITWKDGIIAIWCIIRYRLMD